MVRLLTIGHGTLGIEAFVQLLHSAGVEQLVDVRSVPKSRHNPQFNREVMTGRMSDAGLRYRWERALGGFRKPVAGSRNVALRHASFRGYADYMETPLFWNALDEVLQQASTSVTVIMCSESVWWRCHRRLIADAATLARRGRVEHILHDGRFVEHQLTEGVRLDDGLLAYNAASGRNTRGMRHDDRRTGGDVRPTAP